MAAMSISEIKVGIMVILAITLLVAITISVGDLQNLFSDTITIHILTPRVNGLEPYAQVTYSGVRIGTVGSIRYDEEHEMVVIDAVINRESPVSSDSDVRFTSAGLLSPLYIEITGGKKELRLHKRIKQNKVKPNEIYMKAEAYYSFGDMLALAGNVEESLEKVQDVLDTLNPTLQQIGGLVSNVSAEANIILHEIDQLAITARPKFIELLDTTHSMIGDASSQIIPTLKDIREGAGKVPALMEHAGAGVTRVIKQTSDLIDSVSPEVVNTIATLRITIENLHERITIIEKNLSTLLSDVDHLVVENRVDIDRMIQFLERTAANLDDLSAQLAKNPWRVIWKTDERKNPLRVSPDWQPFDK